MLFVFFGAGKILQDGWLVGYARKQCYKVISYLFWWISQEYRTALGRIIDPRQVPGNAGGRHNWTPCRFGAPEVGRLGHGEHRTTGGGSGGATTRGWGLVTGGWEMGGWAASVWIWVKLRCDDCKKFPVEFVFFFRITCGQMPNETWINLLWNLNWPERIPTIPKVDNFI